MGISLSACMKMKIGHLKILCLLFFIVSSSFVYADTNMTIGNVASTITQSFKNLAKLITAGSYLAGLAFSIGAIMKFKQHKDNPTQIPVGTPIAMLFIASALLFLPSLLDVTGNTMFGTGAKTGTWSGIIFSGPGD